MKYSALVFFAAIQAGAYSVKIKSYDLVRKVAGVAAADAEQNLLIYDSPDARPANTVVINANTWATFKKQDMARMDFLMKIYHANIKDVSNSGQRHVGCFLGDAETVARQFFTDSHPIANVQNLFVTVSEDRKLLGFEFQHNGVSSHFRMPHCIQGGKSPLIGLDKVRSMKGVPDGKDPIVPVGDARNIKPPVVGDPAENGFDIYDKLNPEDVVLEAGLPQFKISADYDKLNPKPELRPWKGMDIRTEEGAGRFAQVVLDYFYDSLVQDPNKADNNFISQNIKADKPRWCHMPWLNVGDSGRERIHGLTKERDLGKSEIYPEAAADKSKEGSDWGVGFYNDISCSTIQSIFGTQEKPASIPGFRGKYFPDGSVSVKILFTTATLDALKGAFAWTANVSPAKSNVRRLKEVKMLQIDVAVKDSTVLGAKPEADHWIMTTFYYDLTYKSTSRHKYTGVLAGLMKMRPIGIQTGFDPSTSMIFKGSKTNSADNVYYGARPMLLNGPADNPKTSCFSCHGVAGTAQPMVPGVKDFNEYLVLKAEGLDFSQQIALAKRNYETRLGQKKEGP